jgi:phenylacetate-CoA ligase
MVERLDLSELPYLTKEDVRTHFAELCADNWRQYHVAPTHTSGSTGTPTKFLLDRESNVAHFAFIWRVLNWTGYRIGNRFADLTGHVSKRGRLFEYDLRLNCLHLSSFDFKRENIGRYVDRLRRFRPVVFKAYPSSLHLFCRWVRDAGLEPPTPRAILTCAESLLDHQRAMIEATIPVPLFDFYNQNERAALISTCEMSRYHVHEEYSLVELIHGAGRSEEDAEIVATTFHNLAMPLIRYRTGDLATPDDGRPCACGRHYQTVASIQGRIEDVVVTPDGRHVGRLDAAFKYSPGIRLSRIVQRTPREIRIDIVKAATYSTQDGETLERELRARLGSAIGIHFNFVKEIPVESNGKIKFVISEPGRAAIDNSSGTG